MWYEAIRYDLHTALTGEDYRKNYFYFFLQLQKLKFRITLMFLLYQELINGSGVSVWHGLEDSETEAGTQDCN